MTSRKGSKYVSGSTDAQSACVTRYFGDTVFPSLALACQLVCERCHVAISGFLM